MSTTLVTAVSSLALTGLALASESEAAIRESTNIPAQEIGSALLTLEKASNLEVIFVAEDLRNVRTAGAVGELTPEETLKQLLTGTGLTYKYLDGNTITILPQAPATRIRLARADAGGEDTGKAATDKDAFGELEEIIVTATKRAERLVDVPISIGVVTADDIDRRGLVSGEDYLRGIPGVAQGGNGMYGDSVVIRGIETSRQGQNFRTGNTVAMYFGETPITTSRGLWGGTNIDVKLVDIDRVEVLRGPQGTAFGSSAIGGAVRTIPVAPKLDRFEAKVAANYSHTSGTGGDNNMMQGMANIPLIDDRLALRVVGYRFEDSGYYRNIAGSDPTFQSTVVIPTGHQAFAKDEESVGGTRFLGGRAALLFQATDNLKLSLNYLKQDIEQDGFPAETSGYYSQTVLQVSREHQYRGETGATNDSNIEVVNATLNYDFGWSDLFVTYSDSSSGSRPVFPYTGLADNSAYAPTSASPLSKQNANFSEMRLTTKLDGAWNFLGGLYVEDIDDSSVYSFYWPGDPSTEPASYQNNRYIGSSLSLRNLKQKAAFAEASWKFLPRFTLTGGARYYDYDRNGEDRNLGASFGTKATPIHKDATGTSFRSNLSFKPTEDTLVYASWAQGFRLGSALPGLGPTCDLNNDGLVDGTTLPMAATRGTESDSVDNYEIGSKLALLNRRVNLSGAVFRMDWTDVPISLLQPPGTASTCSSFIYTTNAGEARSKGVELQANFRLPMGFSIDVGGSWTQAEITKAAASVQPSSGIVVGARLPTPEYNANLGLQYEFDVGSSDAFVRFDNTYVGSYFDNIKKTALTSAGGYTKVDATARVNFENHLSVDVFVRNLTNQDDYTFRGTRSFGSHFGYRLQPRTVGLQLGYTF